ELGPRVVPHHDAVLAHALTKLGNDVVRQQVCHVVARWSAAAVAGWWRCAMSWSTGTVGSLRACHFSPLAGSWAQNTSSRRWAIARLRSLAHLGTTRSGQRCMASCAQS